MNFLFVPQAFHSSTNVDTYQEAYCKNAQRKHLNLSSSVSNPRQQESLSLILSPPQQLETKERFS